MICISAEIHIDVGRFKGTDRLCNVVKLSM